MKRKVGTSIAVVILLCVLMIIPVCAAVQWEVVQTCSIDLELSGTTAKCSLTVIAADSDAEITATIKLQKKGLFGIYTTKETWNDVIESGVMSFYDTYSPVDEGEYRLTADVEVVGDGGNDSFTATATATK